MNGSVKYYLHIKHKQEDGFRPPFQDWDLFPKHWATLTQTIYFFLFIAPQSPLPKKKKKKFLCVCRWSVRVFTLVLWNYTKFLLLIYKLYGTSTKNRASFNVCINPKLFCFAFRLLSTLVTLHLQFVGTG